MKSELRSFVKRAVRQGSWGLLQRYSVAERILELPPVPVRPCREFALHTLVCERDAVMLHWALRSFLHHYKGECSVVIHEDGSCTPATLQRIARTFPGATVVPRADSRRRLESALAEYPALLARCKSTFASIKYVDFYLMHDSEQVIFLDPDVLTFAEPKELTEDLDAALWMRDCFYSLHISPEEGRTEFGGIELPQLNTGLGRVRRDAFDPHEATRVLEFMTQARIAERARQQGLPKIDDMPFNAVFTAKAGPWRYLPDSYEVATERGLRAVTAKHYTTPARFWFYEEGIPRVAAQLGLELPRWLKERM